MRHVISDLSAVPATSLFTLTDQRNGHRGLRYEMRFRVIISKTIIDQAERAVGNAEIHGDASVAGA
jgi:hypothetical protein